MYDFKYCNYFIRRFKESIKGDSQVIFLYVLWIEVIYSNLVIVSVRLIDIKLLMEIGLVKYLFNIYVIYVIVVNYKLFGL